MKYLIYLLFSGLSLIASAQSNGNNKSLDGEIASIENGLLPKIIIKGDSKAGMNLDARMKALNVPGVSIAVIKDRKLHWAKAYGIANSLSGAKTTANTLFQAGSISKPIAALAILKLIEDGKADLDTDVNTYLKGWKIPETEQTKTEKVTLRRLLTHSAGITVHGFPGYKQTDSFPTDIAVLNGQGNTSNITVDIIPGSLWRYSGGGYTIMEKIVEDISGVSLADYSKKSILSKIGMDQSTFEQPLPEELHKQASAAYDQTGKIIDGQWNNYPEQAAAGLWTTPSDLAKYCLEIQNIMAGKSDGVLSKNTVEKMLTKHKNGWGLGPSLQKEGDSLMFGHGGKNAGFSNNMMAFVEKGHGIIVMTNADNGTVLMGEVIRSVSNYYGWNMTKPETLTTITLPESDLQKFVGSFKMTDNDYYVEIKTKDNTLLAHDKVTGEKIIFYAISKNEFRELGNGNYVKFQKNDAGAIDGFSYNNAYVFKRTE